MRNPRATARVRLWRSVAPDAFAISAKPSIAPV